MSYLLEWLEGQRGLIGETLLRRMVDQVMVKRASLLDVLLPIKPGQEPEAPAVDSIQTPQRLALLFALKDRLSGWVVSNDLSVASAHKLREHINDIITREYPDAAQETPAVLPDARSEEVSALILESISNWQAARLITADEAKNLREMRDKSRADVIAPEPAEPRPLPIGLSVEQMNRLALLHAALKRMPDWVQASGLGYMVSVSLRDELSRLIAAVHPDAASGALLPYLFDVTEDEVRGFFLSKLGPWVVDSYLTETDARVLGEYLRRAPEELALTDMAVAEPAPAVAAESTTVPQVQVRLPDAAAARPKSRQPAAPPKSKAAPKPKAPPKPKEPLIQWDKLWGKVVEAAVSGLLLRWLRYLGAFLFVVSVAIVVVNFWNEIPQMGQVAIIFFIPTAFYGGGLLLRKKLGVVQTGGVLMGVGQILLAIDFAAIYQFGGLTTDPRTYWLLTSAICTAFYVFSVFFVVQAEFFGYIGLLGIGSTVAAGVAMATVSLEWPLVAGAGVAALGVEFGHRLKGKSEKWHEIAESGLRFPQFIIPMILLLLLLLPTPNIRWAQAAGFLVATFAAGLLALRLGIALYTHATVWFSALTAVMFLRSLQVDWTWYPTAAGVLALFYNGVIPLMQRGSEEVQARRRPHLLPFEVGALAMLVLAVVSGLVVTGFELWAGVISLTLAVAVMAIKAVTGRKPLYIAAAAVLFFVPLSLASVEWMSEIVGRWAWMLGIWTAAAFTYMAVTAVFRRQDAYVGWLALTAQAAVLFSLGGLAVFPIIRVSMPWNVVAIVFGAVVLFYVFCAVLHHSGKHPALYDWIERFAPKPLRAGIFVWAAAVLLPAWLAVFWQSTILQSTWLAVGMAVLGLAYAGFSLPAGKLNPAYALPFRTLPYIIGLFGILPALGESLPLMIALFIQTAVFGLLAVLHRTWIDTAVAAFILLLPFTLAMERLNIEPQAYSIGYMALVMLVYIPLADLLAQRRKGEYHHIPLRWIGYAMSVVAVVLSVLGAFRMFGFEILWIGILVPAAAALLYGYSTFRVHAWFSWAAVLMPVLAFWQGLLFFNVLTEWQASAWVSFGLVYLIAGFLANRSGAWKARMRLPLNIGAWLLAGLGLVLTQPFTSVALLRGSSFVEAAQFAAPVTAQWLAAGFVVLAAILYRSRAPLLLEPWLVFLPATLMLVGYGESWFGRMVTSGEFSILWAGLGLVHLLLGAGFDQVSLRRGDGRGFAAGIYLGAYLQSFLAAAWSLGRGSPFLWAFGLLIVAGIFSAVAVHMRRHLPWAELRTLLFKKGTGGTVHKIYDSLFIWLAAWTLPIWAAEFLAQLPVLPAYEWLGYVGTALVLFAAARRLARVETSYTWPLYLSGQAFTAITWLSSLPFTLQILGNGAVIGRDETTGIAVLLMQVLSVVYYAWFVVVHRRDTQGYVFAYLAAGLVLLPYTLLLQIFGLALTGRILRPVDFSVAWVLLAGVLVTAAVLIEQRRGLEAKGRRISLDAFSAHGLHLVGYALADFALVWALTSWLQTNMGAIILAMGGWILLMVASAWLVHARRHPSWEDLMGALFGSSGGTVADVVRSAFMWFAAWTLPVWVTIVLWHFDVVWAFGYLGYSVTALVFLGLAVLLGRVRRVYAWPFVSAGQFFNLLALSQGLPITMRVLEGRQLTETQTLAATGFMVVQAVGILFFTASTAYFRKHRLTARVFSYLSALPAWVPVTLGAVVLFYDVIDARLAYVWSGLAVLLLAAGFGLDASERRRRAEKRTGFAHGPYLSGYVALAYALFWAWPFRPVWLVSAGAFLLILLITHWTVHTRRHDTWADMLGFFFARADDSLRSGVRSAFLWCAAVLFPVWLTTLLAYQEVPMAWRGLALALTAPVYVAFGLALRRVDGAYSLPLYVTGYLLTGIGAMVAFDDPLLAIYVLALDAVVYAVSAYIFRQSIWLYLTTVLVPVISVMILQYSLEALPAEWLTGIFMGLAYLYMAIGQVFDRRRQPGSAVHAYALPFLTPAFLLSALGLATASTGRELAVIGYLAGVVFYAFSAWRFRESVFLYPAAWLAAVPYYLGMTYTRLDPDWYGIGWLPLIAAAFVLGRWVFHRNRDRLSLTHAAMPFYLLTYALSLSMLLIARNEMLALAVSLSAAGILYLLSAWVFRRAVWLYPGLLAGHLAIAVFTQVNPKGYPLHMLAVVFLPVTAFVTIMGAWLWKNATRLAGSDWKQAALDWAAPFLVFGALDLVTWQIVAAFSTDSGVVVAGIHAVIVGVVAVLWVSAPVVWVSLGFLVLAMVFRLLSMDLVLPASGAVLAGTGFIVYLAGRMLAELAGRISQRRTDEKPHPVVQLWAAPVTLLGLGLNAAGLLAAIGFVFSETSLVAASLVFVGAVGLAEAYRRRRYTLGYVSVAVLEFSYVLLMLDQDISQLQWYAIPAGLYLVGVAYFERRRGRGSFATLLESLGLIAMLLTSFGQSLSQTAGSWYFLLMLVESVLIIAWSAQQRRKLPFLLGAAGSVANVIGQVVIVYLGGADMQRFLIFAGVGFVILMAAIFAERWVIPRAQDLRDRLESWS